MFEWSWSYLLHFMGAMVIAIIVSFKSPVWVPFVMVPIVGVLMWYRERWQHPDRPLNLHNWIEAVTWPAGCLVGACISLAWAL